MEAKLLGGSGFGVASYVSISAYLLWQFLAIFLISYWFQLAHAKVERCFVEGQVLDCLISYLRHRCLISNCLFNDRRLKLFRRMSKDARFADSAMTLR